MKNAPEVFPTWQAVDKGAKVLAAGLYMINLQLELSLKAIFKNGTPPKISLCAFAVFP